MCAAASIDWCDDFLTSWGRGTDFLISMNLWVIISLYIYIYFFFLVKICWSKSFHVLGTFETQSQSDPSSRRVLGQPPADMGSLWVFPWTPLGNPITPRHGKKPQVGHSWSPSQSHAPNSTPWPSWLSDCQNSATVREVGYVIHF